MSWTFLLSVLVTWAFTLRPTQLGGPATIVVVSGDSMEPRLSEGDLVVLRERPSYAVGDIITFPVPAGEPGEGSLVIHRIRAMEGETFVPRGDNRDRDDDWRPTQESTLGSLWLHVPRGGEIMIRLLDPALLAAVLGGGATVMILLRDPHDKHEGRR